MALRRVAVFPKPDFVRPAEVPEDALSAVFKVKPEVAGMRLDRWLTTAMTRLTRTRAQKICDDWAFDARGKKLSASHKVREAEVIVVYRPRWEEPDAPREISIVYEDAAMVAVNKPAGLPVHPTAKYHRNTLTTVLSERYPGERVVLAHRLDRETSGVLLAARTHAAERALKTAFADREVHKTYLAIVHGEAPDESFWVDAPLALEGGEVGVKMCVRPESKGGMPSRTRVQVVQRLAGFTLVSAHPETGRQHQIRVHLAHRGFPLVGDKLYAHGDEVFLACLAGDVSDEINALLMLDRHALHAHAVEFAHPDDGRSMRLQAPLAPDMAEFCARHASVPTDRPTGARENP